MRTAAQAKSLAEVTNREEHRRITLTKIDTAITSGYMSIVVRTKYISNHLKLELVKKGYTVTALQNIGDHYKVSWK